MTAPVTVVTFEHRAGVTVVDAVPGQNLMTLAVRAGVPGVRAECGGSAACATCHMYVDEDYLASVAEPDATEDEMLDEAWEPRRPNSRLGCQVEVVADTAQIAVVVAEGAA